MNTLLVEGASNGLVGMVIIIGFLIYFIPAFVAKGNNNFTTVLIINIFFGWTLLGWVVALILAFSDSRAPVVISSDTKADKYDQLTKLDALREKGVISTEEFIKEKEKIMKA